MPTESDRIFDLYMLLLNRTSNNKQKIIAKFFASGQQNSGNFKQGGNTK